MLKKIMAIISLIVITVFTTTIMSGCSQTATTSTVYSDTVTAIHSNVDLHNDNNAQRTTNKKETTALSNAEIRQWYNEQVSVVPKLNQEWVTQGWSVEKRARAAYDIRHAARIKARHMMPNLDEVKLLQHRDIQKYGNPDGPTFEQLVNKAKSKGLQGDDIYEYIIDSSQRTDKRTNDKFNVR